MRALKIVLYSNFRVLLSWLVLRKKAVRKRRLVLSIALIIVLVFLLSFGIAFAAVYLMPPPLFHDRIYSIPESKWSSPEIDLYGIGNHIGPPLNATDVPLDTVVYISFMRTQKVSQLQMSPEAAILREEFEASYPASGAFIWYFAEPLKPATTYNATIIWHDIPITWNFTTTDKPFQPRYEAFPNQQGQVLAVSAAFVASVLSVPLIWKRVTMNRWEKLARPSSTAMN